MGKQSIFVSSTPLPLSAVKLGRLVEAPKNPDQGFFDPSEALPDKPEPLSDTTNINNISRLLKASNGCGLEFTLTALASAWLKGENKNVRRLTAEAGRQSLLLNSTEWFNRICQAHETRLWLEKAAMRGRKTYLVTGLETLIKVEVTFDKGFQVRVGGDVQAPVLSATGLPIPTPLDPGAKVDYSIERGKENKYQIQDEKIYSVRYREIKLKKSDSPKQVNALPSSKVWWEQVTSDRTVAEEDDLDEDNTDFIEADILEGIEDLTFYNFEEGDDEVYLYDPSSAGRDGIPNPK
jgi:hypothetical protein